MLQELNIEQLNNPHFVLFPTVTDRTAWHAFGLPAILVVPHSLDLNGKVMAGSEVQSVRILIETASSRAPVVGHVNRGVYKPDENIYVKTLNMSDITSRRFIPGTVTNGKFEYTTRTGITSTLDYISHAAYFDVSDVTIETETLPPARYVMVYESTFAYRRTSKTTGELMCIDYNDIRTGRFTFTINHPGEVIRKIVDITPALYFTNAKRSQDTTIAFYRPMMEVLQDVYDEQNFLEEVNWVYNIQPQYIPYVSYLLGWELPNFPSRSVDNMRKLMLKNVVRLQKLKGTKRVIRELFDLFGVVADITNVWWTPEGTEFVGVNESSAGGTYTVESQPTATTEPILYNYSTSGFGEITAPLINRPARWDMLKERGVVVRAILVTVGSDAYNTLLTWPSEIGAEDYQISQFTDPVLATTSDSLTSPVESSVTQDGFLGSSTVLIDNLGNSSLVDSAGTTPISNIKFDYTLNSMAFNFDKHIEFSNTAIFVFATYGYDKVTVPSAMENYQSNRFDVSLFNPDADNIDTSILPFMVDFLFRVKAFHSLLRKLNYTLTQSEVYQVTDYCVGGDYSQKPELDLGKQQTPPEAIIPGNSSECVRDPVDLGYRQWDIRYRKTIIEQLSAEFEAWKALGDNCSMNKYGQDRVLSSDVRTQRRIVSDGNIYQSDNERTTFCDLDGRDYCYKGRVADVLVDRNIVPSNEYWKFGSGCLLGMGSGVYYDFTTLGVNLHFDNLYKFNDNGNILKHLAVQKPPLGIQKYSMIMPGHRFASISNLVSDFTHPTYKLRPWDTEIKCECGFPTPTWLNAMLTVGTDDDEYLTYDDAPYVVVGNGIAEDIHSMSDHSVGATSGFAESDVAHTMYSSYVTGNDAITFDTLEDVPSGVEFVSTNDPLFESRGLCGSGDYEDYIDGYPASYGTFSGTDFDVDYFPSATPGSDEEELEYGLGIPEESISFVALFTLSSFIRDDDPKYAGYRLDCGCLQAGCSGTSTEQDTTCKIMNFIDDDGRFDFNPDRFELAATARMDENINPESLSMNHLDIILFQLKQLDGEVSQFGYPVSDPFPADGSFEYRDSYGLIYEVSWQTHEPYLDVVVKVEDPRAWGAPRNGRVENHEIYIDGTITTTRDVFRRDNNGDWVLNSSGFISELGEFKWIYVCGNPFINPFIHRLDHEVDDAFSFSTDGHTFTTYGRESATVTHEDSVPVLEFLFGSGI